MRSLALRVLRAENCAPDTEVSVLLTDDESITILNGQYRGIDGPTDVLSFSQREDDEGFRDFQVGTDAESAGHEPVLQPSNPERPGFASAQNLLGDVVISVETAQRQANQRGADLDSEIDVLLAHGLLHLLGYDHARPQDAARMFARQQDLLGIVTDD